MAARAWAPAGAMDREAVWEPLRLAVGAWMEHWLPVPNLRLSQWQIINGAAPPEIGGVSWRMFGAGLAMACSTRGCIRLVQLALDARSDELPDALWDRRLSDAFGERLLDDLARRMEDVLDPAESQELSQRSAPDPFGGLGGALLTLDEGSNPLLTIGVPVQRVMSRFRTGKPRVPADGVTSRRHALGPSQIPFEATLGSVDLELVEFRRLAVGDVLVLDRKLAEPISLRAPGSAAQIAQGVLSEVDGHKALILQPNTSGNDS